MPVQLPVIREDRRRDPAEPLVRRTFKVGELARRSGKTVRALHLYEELGLLEPVERSKGGYRLYGDEALTRVRWIAKLQEMGFSLPDIRTMSQQWEQSDSAPDAMAKVQRLFEEKLEETRAQVARLRTLESELKASLDYLRTCPTCRPDQLIEACSSCERHERDQSAPELVAGFTAH